MPVPVEHPIMYILDEVERIINISGSIPLSEDGFAYPSKLGYTIYSLPDSIME